MNGVVDRVFDLKVSKGRYKGEWIACVMVRDRANNGLLIPLDAAMAFFDGDDNGDRYRAVFPELSAGDYPT